MSKEDKTAFDVLNGAVSVTGSVKEQVNTALESAKSYADGLNTSMDSRVDALEAMVGLGDGEGESLSEQVAANKKATEDNAAAIKVISDDYLKGSDKTELTSAIAAAKSEVVGTLDDGDAATIAALNDKIEEVESAAKSYEIVEITEGLASNVLKAYELHDEDGTKAGERIEIFKDSSLKEVKLDGQTLNFTYILVDGSESTVGVDVSTFLAESEFGNGLQVVDHIVSVKVDDMSESYLSVSADGIKLSGVNTAIETAANAAQEAGEAAAADALANAKTYADAIKVNGKAQTNQEITVGAADIAYSDSNVSDAISALETAVGTGGSVDSKITAAVQALDAEVTSTDGSKVTVKVTEVDGKLTAINVTESDIASAESLSNLTNLVGTAADGATAETAFGKAAKAQAAAEAASTAAANAKSDAIAHADGLKAAVDAYTVNGKAISTNPTLDATNIQLGTYTAVADNNIDITATTTIADAIKALEDAWTWGEA